MRGLPGARGLHLVPARPSQQKCRRPVYRAPSTGLAGVSRPGAGRRHASQGGRRASAVTRRTGAASRLIGLWVRFPGFTGLWAGLPAGLQVNNPVEAPGFPKPPPPGASPCRLPARRVTQTRLRTPALSGHDQGATSVQGGIVPGAANCAKWGRCDCRCTKCQAVYIMAHCWEHVSGCHHDCWPDK
jgi:hypothetical protein